MCQGALKLSHFGITNGLKKGAKSHFSKNDFGLLQMQVSEPSPFAVRFDTFWHINPNQLVASPGAVLLSRVESGKGM